MSNKEHAEFRAQLNVRFKDSHFTELAKVGSLKNEKEKGVDEIR